jgi:hypothetical protein
VDGEVLHVNLPSEEEVKKLVSTSEKQYKERLGMRLINLYLVNCFFKKNLYLVNLFIDLIYAYITHKFLSSSPFFYLPIYILFCGIDIVFSSLSFENKPVLERYTMTFIKGSWIRFPRCYFCAILSIFLPFIWVYLYPLLRINIYCMGFSSPALSLWA